MSGFATRLQQGVGGSQISFADPEPTRLLSRQTVAVIGDDRVVAAGITNVQNALIANGFLSANVWVYAVNGKTTAAADSNGKTVMANVADARDYFGGDPDAWVFVVGSNSAASSEMTEPLLGVQNNYDRRLVWLSHSSTSFNTMAAPLVQAKKNAVFLTTSASGSSLTTYIVQNVGPAKAGADGSWTKAQLLTTPARAGSTITDASTGRTWSTVRYEDTYVSGDTFQQTLNRVTGGKILTLPDGVYTIAGFPNGYNDGVRIGSGGTTGCMGIAGSGRNTIIRLQANSASGGGNIIGVDMLSAGPVYFGNFQLQADDQAAGVTTWAGIFIDNSPGSLVEWVYLNGASKGYANYPPGETFGINFYRSNNCVIRDSEVDGRNRTSGVRQAASPCGWNGVSGAYAQNAKVERCYFHHSLTSMLTFWQTNNVMVNNFHSWSDGSGSGQLSGSQINLEEVTGQVRINYSRLYAYGSYYKQTGWPNDPLATGNVDFLFAQASTIQDMPDCIVTEPRFDVGVNGLFTSTDYAGYTSSGGNPNVVTTKPTIIKNGVSLVGHAHNTSGWQSSATLDTDFTWVR